MKADYSDQTDIFDPSKFSWGIEVIGLGGIGSALLPPLLKLGVHRLTLWDDDHVESHNIPAQLIYRPSDIGLSKTEAARQFCDRQEADCVIQTNNRRVDAETPLEGIVISGVDTMSARKAIWEAVRWNANVPLYMDGRIGGENLQLLTLNPCDLEAIEKYEKWFFDDSEASELLCAARTIIYPAGALANLMVAQLPLFLREENFFFNITGNMHQLKMETS